MQIKTTFIIRNMSQQFYEGVGNAIPGLLALPDAEKFSKLDRLRRELPKNITMKIGNDSFRDRVELNQIMRGAHSVTFTIEPRKGYRLATFEHCAQ